MQCRRPKRCGFDPWVRKIPWIKKQLPTPVFWKILWTGEPVRYSPGGYTELDMIEPLTLQPKWVLVSWPGIKLCVGSSEP